MNEDVIITVVSTILGSSVLNGIITHILYSNKLKQESKARKENMISEKIEAALFYARDLELRLKTQEIYDIKNRMKEKDDVDFFGGECIYPEIFNNWKTFTGFMDKIQECREEHELYLTCEIALNLVYIDRYTSQLATYMKKYGAEELLPSFGTIFIFDLQRWQKDMDILLVREINRPVHKLESHETRKWKKLRDKILNKRYQNTILYYLLYGKCNKRDADKLNFVKNFLDNVIQDKQM